MKTWDQVIKTAYEIYLTRDNYAYWYGCKGQVLTDKVMDSLINEYSDYFSRYSEEQIKQFKNYSRGKIGGDCSWFVCKCLGIDNIYSGAIWDNCLNKDSNKYNGVGGSVLYMPGHVGIDCSYGLSLDFPGMGRTCELTRHKDGKRNWTGCGQYRLVDYSGANNK